MSDPRQYFDAWLGANEQALLVDANGLTLAGAYYADGRDVAHEVSAALSGISEQAFRATRHLDIGAWRSIVFETESAIIALSPVSGHPEPLTRHSERSGSHPERSG